MSDEMEDEDADSRWVTDTEDSVSQKRLTCETRYQGKGEEEQHSQQHKVRLILFARHCKSVTVDVKVEKSVPIGLYKKVCWWICKSSNV